MEEKRIGRYLVKKTLGTGAMGSVFLAEDPLIGRTVAIKTIHTRILANRADREAYYARFLREAQIVGRLRHPGIVTIHDMGQEDDTPFLVLEHVRGRDLADFLTSGRPITRSLAQELVAQMASALTAAHAEGIVHRDLKPQNVMLTEKGKIKVLDFGIARLRGMEITAAGEFLGTPTYSSPEQIMDGDVDHRSDLFSFAVLIHRFFTGQDPFAGENVRAIFLKILHERPKLADPYATLELSQADFQAVMLKALSKKPADRFQTAQEMADSFARLFSGVPRVDPDAETYVIEYETNVSRASKPKEDAQTRHIKTLRTRFHQALDNQNLMACRNLIKNLERRGASVAAEGIALKGLKTKSRKQTISGHRVSFEAALASNRLEEAQTCLSKLEGLGEGVDDLSKTLQLRKQEWEQRVYATKRRLDRTLKANDLGKARARIRELKKLGADTRDAQSAVSDLQNGKLAVARDTLKEITAAREGFAHALERSNPAEAETRLEELKRLGAPLRDEEERLALAKRELSQARRRNARALERACRRAARNGNLEEAEHSYTLLVNAEEEEAVLEPLRVLVEKTRVKWRKKRIKQLEKEFAQALDVADGDAARAAQQELAMLEADSDTYSWLLRKAAGRDPGPKPGSSRRVLVLVMGILLVATFLWFFQDKVF